MEKSVLQRLFGFLFDLSDQRKADPPSDDDPGDKKRPRLTVIEGGKGKEDREGNERIKPCAVIGIPYSSDAAEETVEKEEESIMKSIAKYMFVFAAVAAAVFALSACGGGGGSTVQGSSPAISAGTMAKGSVIVNGIRFEDTAANIHPDDTNKVFLPADLKDGMNVKVKGRINDDRLTGRADEIEVENEVRGSITALGADSFTVLGQTVFVDGGTVFANVANFAALIVGNAVEVHGQRDAAGSIRATRVELLTGPGAVVDELRGVVANKTLGPAGTFTIGGATFAYDALTVIVDLPGGPTFADGTLVEVHLDAGTNRANRIEIEDDEDAEFEPAEGQEFEVEGFVTGLSGNDLFVNGQAVRLTGSTRFDAGLPADLVNDVRVEAEGHMVAGVLVADKITFKDSVRMETNATAASATSVTVFGKTVNITGTTVVSGIPSVGAGLRIRAFLNNDNTTFTATRIDVLSGPVSASQHILQGTVGSFNATARTLVIFGLTVDASGVPAIEVQNDADQVITFDQFFGAITLNRTFVKARGSFSGSTLTANKIELE